MAYISQLYDIDKKIIGFLCDISDKINIALTNKSLNLLIRSGQIYFYLSRFINIIENKFKIPSIITGLKMVLLYDHVTGIHKIFSDNLKQLYIKYVKLQETFEYFIPTIIDNKTFFLPDTLTDLTIKNIYCFINLSHQNIINITINATCVYIQNLPINIKKLIILICPNNKIRIDKKYKNITEFYYNKNKFLPPDNYFY